MPIDKQGLTLEQWKAAELIALGTKMKTKELAKASGVKASTVREWKKDPKFKLAVLKKFEDNMAELRNKRLGRIKDWLDKMYTQIGMQLDNLEEDDYSLKELLNMVTKLHGEVRVDNTQFSKSKHLLEMLAEYTGRDPDAIGEEEEGLDSIEDRYMERRKREQEESESKVRDIGTAKKKKSKAAN